jgi:hypothetical protein
VARAWTCIYRIDGPSRIERLRFEPRLIRALRRAGGNLARRPGIGVAVIAEHETVTLYTKSYT